MLKFKKRPLPHKVERAILRLFEDLATPTSLKVSLLYRYGEWDQLAAARVDPRHYKTAHEYWLDASAVSLLRKYQGLPTTIDRKAAAEGVFEKAEEQCFRTNLRLTPYLNPWFQPGQPLVPRLVEFFNELRKKVKGILGPCPDLVEGRFGPGATFGDKGGRTTIPHKMSIEPTITSDAWAFLVPWSATQWASACASSGKSPSFVPGNRFTTVDKDSETDRGICIEPSINVYYQLAYGRAVRRRLERSGINLQNGKSIHARVAREASISGDFCTIDLKAASDTISRVLVMLALPSDWFEVLDSLRSKKTCFKDQWRLLEKFSSMGNGFTFELETLIFMSLIWTLHPELTPGVDLFVYGDDIIVPTRLSKTVIHCLEFCGLTINEAKTFVDGPFKESCGGDYFNGVDVRPHFLKETPCEPQQLISLANGIRRLGKGADGRAHILGNAWFGILDCLPIHIRNLRGPEELGDLCVHDEESRWRPRWRSGIRYFGVYRPARYRCIPWHTFKPEVVLASALYGVNSGLNYGGVIPRDGVTGYKVGWVSYS